jgi:hypothetical protein
LHERTSWSPELDGAVSGVEEIEGAFADLEIAASDGLILGGSVAIFEWRWKDPKTVRIRLCNEPLELLSK